MNPPRYYVPGSAVIEDTDEIRKYKDGIDFYNKQIENIKIYGRDKVYYLYDGKVPKGPSKLEKYFAEKYEKDKAHDIAVRTKRNKNNMKLNICSLK